MKRRYNLTGVGVAVAETLGRSRCVIEQTFFAVIRSR